jgi:ATP-binding cassette subfamily A (ABC1) protein 3
MFEITKYYFTGGICLIILKIFDYYTPYLVLFYLVYGPPLIFFTYFVSFFYEDESTAQNKMVLLHSLIGVLGSSTVIVLRGNESASGMGKMIQANFTPLPSFLFNFGFSLGFNKIYIYMVDYKNDMASFSDKVLIEKFNLLLGPLIILASESIIYLALLFFMEFLTYSNFCKITTNNILIDETKVKDEGVLNEMQKASQSQIIPNNNIIINENSDFNINDSDEKLMNLNTNEEPKNKFIVIIRNLKKIYKTGYYKYFVCCCKEKGKVAIKNLNFCLEKGECFGLLGLNGAGKTSTFKCITQEITPSNGEIIINGVKSQNNFNLIKNIFGYCPQYDAIFEYMTVYENLEFYAKIKGVKQEYLKQIVEIVIKEMRLEEFTKKISGRLSGGNKRKLSVAIAMLCNPPIILLDEPSTGMDPEARRFMWSIIHKMSKKGKKSSIIMTTHSMDEAETLCKRMAIMVNGEFVCLGKAYEIKNKYGYGYELNLRIKPMTENKKMIYIFLNIILIVRLL